MYLAVKIIISNSTIPKKKVFSSFDSDTGVCMGVKHGLVRHV